MKKLSILELKLEMANNSVLLTSVVYFFCGDGKIGPPFWMLLDCRGEACLARNVV